MTKMTQEKNDQMSQRKKNSTRLKHFLKKIDGIVFLIESALFNLPQSYFRLKSLI